MLVRVERGGDWCSSRIEELTDEELDEWIEERKREGMQGWGWVRRLALALRETRRER